MHADEDKKKRESVDTRNQLENAIYQAEKLPDENKDKVSDDDKKAIAEAVTVAKKVKDDDASDKETLEAALKALNEVIMPIGAKLYEAAAAEEKTAEGDDKKAEDEPVEGEVIDKEDTDKKDKKSDK